MVSQKGVLTHRLDVQAAICFFYGPFHNPTACLFTQVLLQGLPCDGGLLVVPIQAPHVSKIASGLYAESTNRTFLRLAAVPKSRLAATWSTGGQSVTTVSTALFGNVIPVSDEWNRLAVSKRQRILAVANA